MWLVIDYEYFAHYPFPVAGTGRKFDRKTHSAGLVASEHDFASVGSDDIACDRESEPVPSLLGGKQWFENSIDALFRDRPG